MEKATMDVDRKMPCGQDTRRKLLFCEGRFADEVSSLSMQSERNLLLNLAYSLTLIKRDMGK